ncbi:phage integrase SAM-like domain and Arm DNA-binding domain-containing protein [Arenibacter sp. GZD96]|uniref:phage integrase SAM-like domain and Arm DNA-binding domain-containing protein n=1 Tax=Aurantibrevibacter litoralis TaxID=3106030 RepID=UPI002AFE4E97|nr:phage integrase SAM-like domain and Arm DNA-binding domain-containing protein [Arenibacter sp. GZD-96]MEA1785513.1 phage integrase SAM-like domain and Arm DNA-binding domain-containing protein [Arenibacter sp. GZD-96]
MKKNENFAIQFYTRKSRSIPNQLSVYVRITAKGKRAEISLKQSIDSLEWYNRGGRGRNHSQRGRSINAYLDQVRIQLLQCHDQLMEEGKIASSAAIKLRFLGEDDVGRTLMDLIAYHNETMVHVLKRGASKNYYTTEKYLRRFLSAKLRTDDVHLRQLNYRFILDFEQYLRNCTDSKKVLILGNNGVMKHLERLKKMANLAVKLEWIAKNPFDQFQLKFNKFDRIYLTEREPQLIEETIFMQPRLEHSPKSVSS